jgi:hypothetical protein
MAKVLLELMCMWTSEMKFHLDTSSVVQLSCFTRVDEKEPLGNAHDGCTTDDVSKWNFISLVHMHISSSKTLAISSELAG